LGELRATISGIGSADLFGPHSSQWSSPPSAWVRAALACVIAAGLALRVAYPGSTAFCNDQARACALAEDIAGGHRQTGGLVNSGGFRNLPGFVYVLAGVWKLWPSPQALVCFTGVLNALAVLGAGWLARRWIGSAGAWWATAFFAAGPWAIQYCRWIWAQDLLFPAALAVYYFLWRWFALGKRWAAAGVILALTVLVQVHLVGVVLALAVVLLALWCRPKLPAAPLAAGAVIAVASALPYLLAGHLGVPRPGRVGYEHFWRVVPSAAMSVSGLGWQLEFRRGYPAFAESAGWRMGAYAAMTCVPLLLLGAGVISGLGRIIGARRGGSAGRRTGLAMTVALVVLIPLSFVLTGIRTSPTYLPLWYPLPFVLIGWVAARLTARRGWRLGGAWLAPVLLAALCGQLLFFAEQLRYIHAHGGVPGSVLGRSYAGLRSDVQQAAASTGAAEVWMLHEGSSGIQDEAPAYMFRRARWGRLTSGRVLIRFRDGLTPGAGRSILESLDGGRQPQQAFLVRPWRGQQQKDGRIPRQP